MKERILVIEDDEATVRILQRALTGDGYTVEVCRDGESGLVSLQSAEPDVVILDWILPGIDGLEVCRKIRTSKNLPILMLTGRDQLRDRVTGLDAGADDYVVKPFEIPELSARVRALLRRTSSGREMTYQFADLMLDPSTRQASRSGRMIDLTAKEYELLELFMRYPRKVLARELIYDRVWGYDFGGESNVLDVYIRYLRQKLEHKGENRLIQTARGIGYVLRENH